jgi:hypothetical protein
MQIRPMQASDDDLVLLKNLFNANDSPRTLDDLRWRYPRNPTGKVVVDFAIDEASGELAAAYCVFPAYFKLGTDRVLAVQSLDTLTDERFRGQGLFRKLATSTYGRLADANAALVYGFPNGNSAPGFFGKLGWQRLDPVPFLARPLRLPYIARRMKVPEWVTRWIPSVPFVVPSILSRRNLPIEHVRAFDDSFDRLWTRFSGNIPVALERSATFLTWRYLEHPRATYELRAIKEGGETVGFVAWRVADKHGGRVAYIMELLHDPDRLDVASQLLDHAVRESAADGADIVLAWSLDHSPNRAAFSRSAFLPLPERLRPIELHFGARAFADTATALVAERTNWYLSYTDADTV